MKCFGVCEYVSLLSLIKLSKLNKTLTLFDDICCRHNQTLTDLDTKSLKFEIPWGKSGILQNVNLWCNYPVV